MKKQIQILIIATLLLISFGCQTEDVDINDFELIASTDYIKTYMNVFFEDAATGEAIVTGSVNKMTVNFIGDNKSLVITNAGKRKNSFTTQAGVIQCALDPYAANVSGPDPVLLTIEAKCDGYIPLLRHIRISQEGSNRFYIQMIKKDALPNGVKSQLIENFAQLNTGVVSETVSYELPGTGMKIELNEGTSLKTEDGIALEGQVSLELIHYDVKNANPSMLFPGGLDGQYRDKNGEAQDGFFIPGAWVDINISDVNGNIATQVESGKLEMILPISNTTYNPVSEQTIKPGDKIQLMSFDPTTGIWQFEEEVEYGSDPVRVELKHLSVWSFSHIYSDVFLPDVYSIEINLISEEYDKLKEIFGLNITSDDFEFSFYHRFMDYTYNFHNPACRIPRGNYSFSISCKNEEFSIFKQPEPIDVQIGLHSNVIDINLELIDQINAFNGLIKLTKNGASSLPNNLLVRYKKSGSYDTWSPAITINGGNMSLLIFTGDYDVQVYNDDKWIPELGVEISLSPSSLTAFNKLDQIGIMTIDGDDIKHQGEMMIADQNYYYREITRLLYYAKSDRDKIMIDCLSDKKKEMGKLILVSRNLFESLIDLISNDASGEEILIKMELMNIQFSKVIMLCSEAENCIGMKDMFLRSSSMEVIVDTDLPSEDPSEQLSIEILNKPNVAHPIYK